jgi:glycosyltransferase 2 family protein
VKKAITTTLRAVIGIGLAIWLIFQVASQNRVILGHTDVQTPLTVPLTGFISADAQPKRTQITGFAGIAITARTGAGTWQTSADGGSYSTVGALANSATVLVPAAGSLRYIPAGAEEEATIRYKAWNGDIAESTFSEREDLAFLRVLPVGKKTPTAREATPIAESAVTNPPVLVPGTLNFREEIAASIQSLLVLAVILYGVVLSFGIYRWRILLEVQGIHLRAWDLIKLTMVGQFFNITIPGAVSGDIIKMVYVRDHAPGRTAEAVLTIMLDRIVGILGLFVVAAIAVIASLGYLADADTKVRIGAYIVGAGSIGGIIAVFAVQFREALQRLPGVQGLIDFGARILPGGISATIGRLVQALDLYRERRGTIVLALALSIGVHALLACSIAAIGNGVHEPNLGFRDYFLATQVANAVGAIPVTPGGFGTRDATLAFFFSQAGAGAKASIVPIFYTCVVAFYSLLGGVFFIFMRSDAKALTEEESDAPVAE